ncbi:MAG: Fic family protein [Patulibacter sp.]|nr:Fic family protein [Patulibacter sp.]
MLPFEIRRAATGDVCDELDLLAHQIDARIMPRRWSGRLRRSLEAASVAASTRLEGVPVTVSDVQRILAGDKPPAVSAVDASLVQGYADAMTYVQRRTDDGTLAWSSELLIGLQDRIVAGRKDHGAGRFRTRAVWVTGPDGRQVFSPPDHERVPDLVAEICAQAEAAPWHAAVKSAWLHVVLAAVHPFEDGNGRTARVAASLAMYRGGFRDPAFTSLEEWWGRHPADYYASFGCLGDSFDPSVDVTSFVESHVQAQLVQSVGVALEQKTNGTLMIVLENLLDDRGLPSRLANALYDGVSGLDVTTATYADLSDVSAATARNDLAAAVAAGLLHAEGRTRGRTYTADERLLGALAEALNVDPHLDAIRNELALRATLSVTADRERALHSRSAD